MNELSDKHIKQVCSSLLEKIAKVCDNNNVRYYLGYGSLLGAVRHNGFIPWDDDIDLLMTRTEYAKFEQYCKKNNTGFKLVSNSICGPNYCKLSPRVTDDNTILIEDNSKISKNNFGISIDIFIIEGLGNSYKEALRNFKKKQFKRELLVAANWERYVKKQGGLIRNIIRFFFYILSRFVNSQKIYNEVDRFYSSMSFDQSKYVGVISSPYRKKDIFQKDLFAETKTYYFEDHLYISVKDYDSYLSQLYGDYMTPPPINKRLSNHSFKAYYKYCEGENNESADS